MGLRIYKETIPSFGKRELLAGYENINVQTGHRMIDWAVCQESKKNPSLHSLVLLMEHPIEADVQIRVGLLSRGRSQQIVAVIYGEWYDDPVEGQPAPETEAPR